MAALQPARADAARAAASADSDPLCTHPTLRQGEEKISAESLLCGDSSSHSLDPTRPCQCYADWGTVNCDHGDGNGGIRRLHAREGEGQ